MTKAIPFRFSNSFDVAEPIVEEVINALIYTEDDLMIAKEIAHNQGMVEGRALAEQTVEAELVKAMIGFQDQLVRFVDKESERRREVQYQAAQLARSVAVKICITELEQYAVDRVVSCMDTLTKALLEKPKMNVNVHPDLAASLSSRVKDMITQGTLHVNIDPSLSMLDCKFEWIDGGAEVMLAKTLSQVDTLIQQIKD